MAEWEDKLGAILNDPQAMSRIMALAQSLGGESKGDASPPPGEPEPEPPAETGGLGLDPKLMEMGMRAMAAYQSGDDKRTALLEALRPFVKEARYAKVDRAIQIAKLSRVVRAALEGLKGGEGHVQ